MLAPTRVAAIDCGTNSIRLLIADLYPDGTAVDLVRTMDVVRLGEGVDATGNLAPRALARALDMTRQYARVIRDLGATRVRFVATSATRDAANRAEFADGVRAVLGVDLEVVTGAQEARLSFRGATGVLTAHPAPYLVVDLGGGSTELVFGTGAPEAMTSLDVGCVRMSERHLHADPPTPAQVAAATADIDRELDAASRALPLGRTATLVGLSGTITTVTAHALGLARYEPNRIDAAVLGVAQTLAACDDLLHRTRAQRRALAFMHAGRADVIGGGALVWSRVVRRVHDDVARQGGALTTLVTSEHDILDAIAWSLGQEVTACAAAPGAPNDRRP